MKTRKELVDEAIKALENIETMLLAGEIDEYTAQTRRLAIMLVLSK
jgi:hypothetical protein